MVLEMQKAVLPQVAKSIADPMAQIGDVKIYGTTGQEIGGISNNVPTLMKKAFDLVGDVSGVDPAEIIKAGTISAKTDRNINIEGLPENMVPTPGNM